MQPGRARTSGLGVPPLLLARWVGLVAPVRPTHGVWFVVYCPSAALRAQCPGPLGSCSPLCPLDAFCVVCGVICHFTPVHRCAPSVCCVACAVSWGTWLLFTRVLAPCAVLCVSCPEPLGSCAQVCPLGVLGGVCGVLVHLAPVHRCARSECCFGCAVSWAGWILFTGAHARCVVMRLQCPWPLHFCSPVCPPLLLCRVSGVLGHLAPVQRFTCSACCVACAVFVATRLLFTGVLARCVVLGMRFPQPLDSCSAVCSLDALCIVCGVLGHLALVHWCACSACCVVCAVSWATWLLFTGVLARFFVLRVRCPGPLGSCSPVRTPGVLCCLCRGKRCVPFSSWGNSWYS